MARTIYHDKYVTHICSLQIGDFVTVEGVEPVVKRIIEDIGRGPGPSGISVKVSGISSTWIDSDRLNKV